MWCDIDDNIKAFSKLVRIADGFTHILQGEAIIANPQAVTGFASVYGISAVSERNFHCVWVTGWAKKFGFIVYGHGQLDLDQVSRKFALRLAESRDQKFDVHQKIALPSTPEVVFRPSIQGNFADSKLCVSLLSHSPSDGIYVNRHSAVNTNREPWWVVKRLPPGGTGNGSTSRHWKGDV